MVLESVLVSFKWLSDKETLTETSECCFVEEGGGIFN